MIAAVAGRLAGRRADSLSIDIGPVVLQVHASAATIAAAGEVGDALRLHTYLHVREDQIALYGFATSEELDLFTLLLGVTGIGPRVAANMLGATRPEPLRDAIATEDVAFLGRLPGVGKRTAARIILDLRGKLTASGESRVPSGAPAVDSEVIAALQAFGYSAAEAQAAVESLPRDDAATVETRVIAAFQALGRA